MSKKSFSRNLTRNLLETKILSYVERIKASPEKKEVLILEFQTQIENLDNKIPKKIASKAKDELIRVLESKDKPKVLHIIEDIPRNLRRTKAD